MISRQYDTTQWSDCFFLVLATDIVFFIFLYQRWIYKIDLKRVNEFGVTGEELVHGGPIEDNNQDVATSNGVVSPSDKKND